ncbi:hypothetical protein KSP39_PZI017176 [Platanthera zijinensis]|uniref:Uncharacterized protein n=1 Tax=Platanthera zijinensis TaxID=2320716 RepID=A0AAP0B4W6_9ASPA
MERRRWLCEEDGEDEGGVEKGIPSMGEQEEENKLLGLALGPAIFWYVDLGYHTCMMDACGLCPAVGHLLVSSTNLLAAAAPAPSLHHCFCLPPPPPPPLIYIIITYNVIINVMHLYIYISHV